MNKPTLDNRGVSLAITIGLFLLMMIIVATMGQMVIRAIKAANQVEASDKAYFAAEAGIENALYELSPHLAGYETPNFSEPGVRIDQFSESVTWSNEWELKSRELNTCESDAWSAPFNPSFCGQLYPGQKLTLNLFNDDASSGALKVNQVNVNGAEINTLTINQFELKFRIPTTIVTNNGLTELQIDNDRDYNPNTGEGLNEDGATGFDPEYEPNPCDYSDGVAVDDDDCDNREDEDSREDPVFLWKVIDDEGRSFQPLRGCKDDPNHITHPDDENAGLCEKNFKLGNEGELSVSVTDQDLGFNQKNEIQSLAEFLNETNPNSQLQMEVLAITPNIAFDIFKPFDQQQITFPYFEYGIEYQTAIGDTIPSTFFSLRSDGYFRDFKQSITTNVVPGATTTLLDLTIIQQ